MCAAVDLAHLRATSGDDAGAAALLARARRVFEADPRAQTIGIHRPVLTPIEILVLDDRADEALGELETLVDGGWRNDWQWRLQRNPIFAPIRDDLRYKQLIQRLERDTLRLQHVILPESKGRPVR